MKIDVNRIPPEGTTLEEEISPGELGLNTEVISVSEPVRVRADVSKITNAVTVDLKIKGLLNVDCSRCLEKFKIGLDKDLRLNYEVDKDQPFIELDEDIKAEIILDYPLKPLCKTDCRGLCPECGKNLNQGGCSCATTEKKTL